MPDLLIRDFPAEDLVRLDAQARRLGLSRVEFLRRHLHEAALRGENKVVRADLVHLSALAIDLADSEVMRGAWS